MAKKIGEIKAFCILGHNLFKKSENTLKKVFGKQKVEMITQDLLSCQQEIDIMLQNTDLYEVMNKKAVKTEAKVSKMADNYIGDKWDDPTELCEWLGFFEGAAIVHFSLVFGKAKKAKLRDLEDLTRRGIRLHKTLLDDVTKAIQNLS